MRISRRRAFWPSISCELRLKSRLPRVTNTSQFYHCILTQHLMGALVVAKVVYPGYVSLGSQFITRCSQFITEYSWAMTSSAYQEHGKREGKLSSQQDWKYLSLSWPSTRIMTVQGILKEWAILTEVVDFLTQEMWARIRSDYPANIWKEYKKMIVWEKWNDQE